MSSDKAFDAAKASQPLFAWWLNVIPAFFGGPPAAAATAVAGMPGAAGPLPFPVDQVSQALAMTLQSLGPLYQNYFQALLSNTKPDQAFGAFQELVQAQAKRGAEALAGLGGTPSPTTGMPAPGWGALTQPMATLGEAMKPISLNLERTYGGLADAFGLAPSRGVNEAGREMTAAAFAKQRAQAEYMGLVFASLAKGSEAMLARLAEMGRSGESIDSLLGLVRLWAKTADEALQRDMQAPKALEASANLLRAAMRSREQQQRIVAIASEALNVPTRAEVDEAYREIQELKRELRRLKKAIAPAPEVTPEPQAAPVPKAAAKRAKAPAAKRSKAAKVTSS